MIYIGVNYLHTIKYFKDSISRENILYHASFTTHQSTKGNGKYDFSANSSYMVALSMMLANHASTTITLYWPLG
jgi:hypothetical protein